MRIRTQVARILATGIATAALVGCPASPGTSNVGRGTVEGWVCLGVHGTPSAGALITVQGPTGATATAEADTDGHFIVDDVEAGEVVVIMSNRVDQKIERLTIDEGGTATIGSSCSYQTGIVTVHLCIDGSLDAEIGTSVTLTYLEVGGAAVAPIVGSTDGAGDVDLGPLVPGEYRIEVQGISDSDRIDVQPGASLTWDDPGCYDPASVGSVSGRICNPLDGTPVEGVPVKLAVASEPDRELTTDANGRFRFDAIVPGTHTLTISPPLQAPTELQIDVTAGEATVLPSACTEADTGSLSGVACDPIAGTPLDALNVRLDISGEPARFVATNPGGYYRFVDVPAGTHTVTLPFPGSAPKVMAVTVVVSEETTVAAPECTSSAFGSVTGRVCNPADQQPVADIQVDIDITAEPSPRTTTTDTNGDFAFDMVPPGDHVITIRPPLQAPVTANVTVTAGQETQVPSPVCGSGPIPNPAELTGTACIGISSSNTLAGATIEVDFNPGIVRSMSGTDGSYHIYNLASGVADVTIARGSWSTTFSVTFVEDQIMDLGMTHCVGPGTRVAVVTGPFDDLLSAFSDLGVSSVVDVIDGGSAVDPNSSDEWTDTFFANLSTLQQYDMIFLTSGLKMTRLYETNACGAPPSNTDTPLCRGYPGTVALNNLDAYLQGGGAVYVSDWAYEIIRREYPGYFNFYNLDTFQLKALCGHAPHTANAQVFDENLGFVLGGTGYASIVYEDGFELWAVLEAVSTQPHPFFTPFLVASVPVYVYTVATDDYCDWQASPTIVASSPLISAIPIGTNGGKLVFSTFRYISAGDNAAVIQQILLEL